MCAYVPSMRLLSLLVDSLTINWRIAELPIPPLSFVIAQLKAVL